MKILIIFLFTLCSSQALLTKEAITEKWEHFKHSHARRFRNFREERFRKDIFHKKLQEIEDHNDRYQRGLETYQLGVNQFTDLTDEELHSFTHGLRLPSEMPSSNHTPVVRGRAALPASLDWRSKGAETPVKNQGSCGSCWAFATTGALEAHHRLRTGAAASLSEQQLVDCVAAASGCGGGWMPDAYSYVARNGGINLDRDYPYEQRAGACRYRASRSRVAIWGHVLHVRPGEEALKEMVATQGPVSVAFDASGSFGGYSGGVYYNPKCSGSKFTHAVVIVGYGTERGQDYWLAKNSWGSGWGLGGYFKIARNRGNHCGIATYPSYPVF